MLRISIRELPADHLGQAVICAGGVACVSILGDKRRAKRSLQSSRVYGCNATGREQPRGRGGVPMASECSFGILPAKFDARKPKMLPFQHHSELVRLVASIRNNQRRLGRLQPSLTSGGSHLSLGIVGDDRQDSLFRGREVPKI